MYRLLPAFTPTFIMGPFHFTCDLNSTRQTDQQTPSRSARGGPATNLISYRTNTHARTHVCRHELLRVRALLQLAATSWNKMGNFSLFPLHPPPPPLQTQTTTTQNTQLLKPEKNQMILINTKINKNKLVTIIPFQLQARQRQTKTGKRSFPSILLLLPPPLMQYKVSFSTKFTSLSLNSGCMCVVVVVVVKIVWL